MENLIRYIQTIKDKENEIYINLNSIDLNNKTIEVQIETNDDVKYFILQHGKENINVEELKTIHEILNTNLKEKDLNSFQDNLDEFLYSWTI